MSVITYVKSHPVATGFIVIVGGIIFILIVRGRGSSSSSGGVSGPSDTQIAANTAIEVARINAQASAQQAGAAVSAAQVGAGIQLNSDNRAAEIAMRQLDVAKELGLAQIGAEQGAVNRALDTQESRFRSIIGSLGSVKKKDAGNVLQSLITGQPVISQKRQVSGTAQVIGAGSDLIGNLASIFSDERLKENILHVGFDARGRDLFEYNYKGSNTRRVGHIAQAIARNEPKKVITERKSGYYKILPYQQGGIV